MGDYQFESDGVIVSFYVAFLKLWAWGIGVGWRHGRARDRGLFCIRLKYTYFEKIVSDVRK